MKLAAAIATTLAAATLTLAPATTATAASDPTRVLIVGDSVTSGSLGDYTWRYFAWKALEEQSANVDFVGSASGVYYNWDFNYMGEDAYADPNFDRDHASVSGGRLQFDGHFLRSYNVGDEVTAYDADVVVSLWGINDLADTANTVDDVIGFYRAWFDRVRAAKPEAQIIVAQLPYTWLYEGRVVEFNQKLVELAEELDSAASPVMVVGMEEQYTQAGDSYDHVHPNVSGQQKIGSMMARAIASVLPAPVVVDPAPQPAPEIPTPAPIPPAIAPPAVIQPAPMLPRRPTRVRAVQRGVRVVVKWRRAELAESYRVTCGERTVATDSLRVALRIQPRRCKVRSVAAAGTSPWTQVKVKTRRSRR